MDNIKYLTKNTKDDLMKEIMNHIDQGFIPVGNLEMTKVEDKYDIPEGYEGANNPPMVLIKKGSTEFTQTMYNPSSVSSGGSYKNKNKKKNKTKKN